MDRRPKNGTLQSYDSFEVRLGDELRGERATLGKSLLDVQRDLRIKASYIAAIENCDTSVFQNKGFVAGYVRSYARYLNLDAEVVFERFCRESGFGGVNAGMHPTAKKNANSAGKIKKSKQVLENTLIHPALRNRSIKVSPFAGLSLSGLGSIATLLLLICGLSFGAWSVLQDIQRVQLVPVDQTPGASATMTTPDQPALDVAQQSNDALQQSETSDLLFARVYRPQELDVPVLDHRDGPIAGIDPDSNGIFSGMQVSESTEIASLVEQAMSEQSQPLDPQLVAISSVPVVSVFATSPAWIRVYLADGSRVFEKILETGEAYVLPADIPAALLRAGNSGAVYLSVDNVAFGPIGAGTSIAKEISLETAAIQTNWPIAAEQTEFGLQAVAAAVSLAQNIAPPANGELIPVAIVADTQPDTNRVPNAQ